MSDTDSGQGEFAPPSLADIFDDSKGTPDASGAGQARAADEAAPVDTGETTADAPTGTPRDANGRFTAAPGADAEAAPPAAENEPGTVPYVAFKDERAKRQQAEAELAKLRERDSKASVPDMPSPTDDPEGYRAYVNSRAYQRHLTLSEQAVRESYGSDEVDRMMAVYQAGPAKNPTLHAQVLSDVHPWNAMMAEARKAHALAQIGDDPAAYQARIEAEAERKAAAKYAAGNPVANAPAHNALPTSLAAERNVGSRTPELVVPFEPPESIARFKG